MNEFQKKLKEKIKQYSNKEYMHEYTRREFLTADQDADIFLKIKDKDELFDARTMNHQVDLNPEVYTYLEDKASMLENDIKISLHIIGNELTGEEQAKVQHMFKEHYAVELYKIQKAYNKEKTKIVTMFSFGLLTFGLYFILLNFIDFEFLFEVLSFIFSFAIWEALDGIIYTLSEIKEERESITQNLLINVTFK